MPTSHSSMLLVLGGLLLGCAATMPQELVDAREAYRRASTGPAANLAQAELHVADQALAKAEQSFEKDEDSYRTRDLAYVAERKAQRAEVIASISLQQQEQGKAKADFDPPQGDIVSQAKQDLSDTRAALRASQQRETDAEPRAAAAQAALARLADVRQDSRGTVVTTLSGSVLLASNRSVLLPEARARLDQVADVLLSTRERSLTVEGHTDAQGSEEHNRDPSQRRADAVRDYLAQRGYQADRVKATGLGESRPVAENSGAEGRANNRRVEIAIGPDGQAP